MISNEDAAARRRTRLIAIVMFGGVALVTVGFLVGRSMWQTHAALNNPGRAVDAAIVELEDGKRALVLIDDSGEQTPQRGHHRPLFRIVTVDLDSGKRRQVRVIEDSVKCWTAARNRMWCKANHDGTLLVDATTLATVGVAEQIAVALGKPYGATTALADGGVAVTFNDGRAARVDPLTARATELDPHEIKEGFPATRRCRHASTTKEFAFSAGPRSAVIGRTGSASSAPPPSTQFLEPEFLLTGDGGPVLVHYRATLDTTHKKLSRIDAGRVSWTIDADDCQAMSIDGGRLELATTDPHQRAVAIDIGTGAVIWKFAL